jgi:hypothetical protein
MKKILLFGLLSFSNLTLISAQSNLHGVISLNPSNNVLYTDVDNIIDVAITAAQSVSVTGSGVSLKKINEHQYTARVNSSSKTVTITLKANLGNKKVANVGAFKFNVLPYPAPQLYFDNSDPKSMVSRVGEHVLDVKSPADPYKSMMISNWEVIMENGTSISGTGNNLSPAANAAITAAPARSSVVIAVTYTNSNGGVSETKNTRATFYIE